jgi:hypothetical protein
MTDLRPDPAHEAPDDAVPLWLDDDLDRAAVIYRHARAEADKAHAACAKLPPARLSGWRKPDRSGLLHRRMVTRHRARAARSFIDQALDEWRPAVDRGN